MTLLETIRKNIQGHPLSLEIIVHRPAEESVFSSKLDEIVALVREIGGGGVTVRAGIGAGVPGTPALTFRHPGSGPINYMALPEGQETAPFIEMLVWKTEESVNLPEDVRTALDQLAQPAHISVFTISACPNCPHAVRAANTLALLSPNIATSVIDVEAFPTLAGRFNIRSVPMTVIDDELLINRAVTAGELAEKIISRDNDEFPAEVLLSQVETGNIEMASRVLCTRAHAARAFLSAWRTSALSSRMGLMLAAKQAMEEKRDVLDGIVHGLIAIMGTNDVPMRGDTADLLGEIGHQDARGALEALLNDHDSDIVEIAEEALQRMKFSR